jgi:predicted O-methyltransferase YrrM
MRIATVLIVAALGAANPRANDELTPAVQKLLDEIRAVDKGQLAVSEEDGRFLRVLIASTGAKRVLEIGAASGYSAIWMGLGLRQTGGRLTTIEYDPVRAREAADNVRRAGLQDVITVISGDAFKVIPTLEARLQEVLRSRVSQGDRRRAVSRAQRH